jgi:hypothetical protein
MQEDNLLQSTIKIQSTNHPTRKIIMTTAIRITSSLIVRKPTRSYGRSSGRHYAYRRRGGKESNSPSSQNQHGKWRRTAVVTRMSRGAGGVGLMGWPEFSKCKRCHPVRSMVETQVGGTSHQKGQQGWKVRRRICSLARVPYTFTHDLQCSEIRALLLPKHVLPPNRSIVIAHS